MPESSWLKFLEKNFSKQFCFIRCGNQHLEAVEYRRFSRFILVGNTIINLQKFLRAKFLGRDGLLLVYKILTASRTLLQQLLACLNLTLNSKDLLFWCKWKKVISMNCDSTQAAENHGKWMRLDLILKWGIYTSISTLTHLKNH